MFPARQASHRFSMGLPEEPGRLGRPGHPGHPGAAVLRGQLWQRWASRSICCLVQDRWMREPEELGKPGEPGESGQKQEA